MTYCSTHRLVHLSALIRVRGWLIVVDSIAVNTEIPYWPIYRQLETVKYSAVMDHVSHTLSPQAQGSMQKRDEMSHKWWMTTGKTVISRHGRAVAHINL